jgi:regulatory protein
VFQHEVGLSAARRAAKPFEVMADFTAIEAHPKLPGLARIYIDGALWQTVRAATVIELGLRKGDAATPAVLSAIERADQDHRAYEAALRLLSYRPRARAELRGRLAQRAISEDVIAAVLERLSRAGLVDDNAFAELWVRERSHGAGARGTAGLGAELRAKGVDAATISSAMEALDGERERALEAARVRLNRLAGLPYDAFRRRLGGFLQRRGFTYEAVQYTVRQLWREQRPDDGAVEDPS